MPIRKPSKEEVDALSLMTGEGRMQCNKELTNHFRREHLLHATTLEEVKEVLLSLLPSSSCYVKAAIDAAKLL